MLKSFARLTQAQANLLKVGSEIRFVGSNSDMIGKVIWLGHEFKDVVYIKILITTINDFGVTDRNRRPGDSIDGPIESFAPMG